MNKFLPLLVLLIGSSVVYGQTANEVTNLEDPLLNETSGLIHFNNSLLSINDSGNEPIIYELNMQDGRVTKQFDVTNATNVDWEDLTQDDEFIYIGDFGNNYGMRTNLRIYRISKSQFANDNLQLEADVISFSYPNQTDYTAELNSSNWDAEGFISYKDKLLIFSKNWENREVDVYSIPKTVGEHNAELVSNYNVEGLITAADISEDQRNIYLTGYSSDQAPFMYTIGNIPNNSMDIFTGTVSQKIQSIVPLGYQVEAISFVQQEGDMHKLFISNEKYEFSYGPVTMNFPAKLWSIDIEIESDTLTNNPVTAIDKPFRIFPNPFVNHIKFNETVDNVKVFDTTGKLLMERDNTKKLTLRHLNQGIYIARVLIDGNVITSRIVKR